MTVFFSWSIRGGGGGENSFPQDEQHAIEDILRCGLTSTYVFGQTAAQRGPALTPYPRLKSEPLHTHFSCTQTRQASGNIPKARLSDHGSPRR